MTRSARRVGFLIAVLALAAVPAGRAEAGVITTAEVDLNQEFLGVVDTLRFSFGASGDGLTFHMTSPIDLTEDDVGSVFPLAAPGELFDLLTNGADDTTRALYEAVGSASAPVAEDVPESAFFTDPAIVGPDLSGFDLDRISLRVDSLTFEVTGVDLDRTQIMFTGTLIFEDDVVNPIPAPPSAVLAGIAGVMFLGRAIRRRRAA